MKLTEQECSILSNVHLQADASIRKIAKESCVSENQATYCIKKFIDKKIIHQIDYIDPYMLGYVFQVVYFSLPPQHQKQYGTVLRYLRSSQKVGFLATVGGGYQFKVGLLIRSPSEIVEFQEEIFSKFGDVVSDKQIITILKGSHYPFKLLSPNCRASMTLTFGEVRSVQHVDEVEHLILGKLSNQHRSLRELSRELQISPSTLEYKIAKLKSSGVVVGSKYIINTAALGMQSFFHQIYLAGSAEQKNILKQYLAHHPNIYYVGESIGAWDLDVESVTHCPADIVSITQEISSRFEGTIHKITTFPLFCIEKASYYPFL